uniref:Rio2_N domain-containing protein n=1 Tax=Loa loa TaxID=7209 RepID=A0A1I7W005_LOALO
MSPRYYDFIVLPEHFLFLLHLFVPDMGRMNITVIRYMEQEHFRVLIAVELGMKNHELVPLELIGSIAKIHRGAVVRILADLAKHGTVAHERGKRCKLSPQIR